MIYYVGGIRYYVNSSYLNATIKLGV
jgi:hypothetical protein